MSIPSISPYQSYSQHQIKATTPAQVSFTGINYSKGWQTATNAIKNVKWADYGNAIKKFFNETPAKLEPANQKVGGFFKWLWDLVKPVST